MSNVPTQIRSVDPFSSYHSNITNRLTRIVTKGNNVILGSDSLTLTIDGTTSLNLSPGYVIKDDVLIYYNDDFNIDLTNSDFYLTGTTPLDEEGIYYVTIDYIYQKTKPAPESKIIILKPSQTANISQDRYIFMGALNIIDVGGLIVDEIYDYDPNNTNIKRSIDLTSSITNQLRLYGIFANQEEQFEYIGQTVDKDVEFDSTVGHLDLVYKSPVDNIYYQALAEHSIKKVGVGIADTENNRVMFVGLIQTNLTFEAGDDLFLSDTDPGQITNSPTLLQVGQMINNNGLILANVGTGGSYSERYPYRSKLTLESGKVITIHNDHGAVVPDRYIVEEGAELIIEEDAVFKIV